MRAVAPLAVVALATLASAVAASHDAALAPTGEHTTTPTEFAIAVGKAPLRVVNLQAGGSSPSPSPPPSPPPVTTARACTSHDVYTTLVEAMTVTSNISIVQDQDRAPGSQGSQVSVLIVLGVLSLGLLFFGTAFVQGTVAVTVFIVSFLFIYSVADNLSFDASRQADFSMCVMPLIMSAIAGLLFVLLTLCLIQRVVWTSFFLMGACIGGVLMYVIREIIVSSSPGVASDPAFRWYWLGTAVVALLLGLVAAAMKDVVLAVASITVGAYGVATFVCGIVPAAGGESLGGAAFIAIFIGAGALGALVQFMRNRREAEAKKPVAVSTGTDPLISDV